jgi:hypothetical protein
VNADAVRQFSLALPEATEEPHFHFTSFRIGGKIFATMPPGDRLLHVFVPEEDREAAVAAHPDICESLQWGKRVVGVRIDLASAPEALVTDLIQAAYDLKRRTKRRKQ